MNNAIAANDVTDPRAALARENARLAALPHYKGSKHVSGRTGPEIAKLIREDIKAAIKTGDLPAMKVSVRYELATHSKAIDIVVKAWSGQVWSTARARHDVFTPDAWPMPSRISQGAKNLLVAVTAIANRYNFDRSDTMTDYHNAEFYLSVDFDSALESASQAATEAAVRAAYGVAS